ncbi:hypothetical protein GH714_014003 [Hevea brasiliensis]|uniref:Uncharacterized protein n=1 Tax=Hevea brasiliensis TaxID=3981 RepID=A0A6A6M9X7_HEVBR|nr:hypothetical protein GH714_014003 [Hevea brasiliensis]
MGLLDLLRIKVSIPLDEPFLVGFQNKKFDGRTHWAFSPSQDPEKDDDSPSTYTKPLTTTNSGLFPTKPMNQKEIFEAHNHNGPSSIKETLEHGPKLSISDYSSMGPETHKGLNFSQRTPDNSNGGLSLTWFKQKSLVTYRCHVLTISRNCIGPEAMLPFGDLIGIMTKLFPLRRKNKNPHGIQSSSYKTIANVKSIPKCNWKRQARVQARNNSGITIRELDNIETAKNTEANFTQYILKAHNIDTEAFKIPCLPAIFSEKVEEASPKWPHDD